MSNAKRRATSELNHENWDQADDEPVIMGEYKPASKDILQKRVIKTARRRNFGSGQPEKLNVFSGFGNLSKAAPSSFDFLATLTQANSEEKKSTNGFGSPTTLASSPNPSSIFGNQLSSNTIPLINDNQENNTNNKNVNSNSTSYMNSIFNAGNKTLTESSVFSKASEEQNKTNANQSFSGFQFKSNSEKSEEAPTQSGFQFKINADANTNDGKLEASPKQTGFQFKSNSEKSEEVPKQSGFQFKINADAKTNDGKLEASPKQTGFQFKSNSTEIPNTNFKTIPTEVNKTTVNKPEVNLGFQMKTNSTENKTSSLSKEKEKDQNEIKFYTKLQGLNESVSSWIQKHVSESPICILTPIFRDYERYLKEIEKILEPSQRDKLIPPSLIQNKETIEDLEKSDKSKNEQSVFSKGAVEVKTSTPSASPFSFGVKKDAPAPAKTSTNTFSLANNTQSTSSSTSPFSLSASNSVPTSTPFSFGTGKPFSFSSNTTEKKTDNENEDEEDKIEPQPDIKHEEDSVYDIKCKIFVKKDGNFDGKGVGMLYIKPLESKKYQLLVRANTTVGHVLLNLILNESLPLQRMGKNNVMMVCIPTPEAQPPPVPILIRVKNSEEADDLLETLKKYKT